MPKSPLTLLEPDPPPFCSCCLLHLPRGAHDGSSWLQKGERMRITNELLQTNSSLPIDEVEYLDLSRKDIVIIERLSICRGLRTLILSGNIIKEIQNVDCCRQLWNLDVSGNKLKSLCGLSRFPVLGSVSLGGNELEWQELYRINHITILNLSLMGNPKLDSDPHYRHHVVDMLPNVWMLDGRLITAQERKKVEDFFNESQSSLHPVRRKGSGRAFVPTSLKNLLVSGVFGEKTTHMMSRFPVNYIHNAEMDKKRLSYLVYSIEDDMKLAQHSCCARDSANTSSPTSSEQPHGSDVLRKSHQTPNLLSLFEHRERGTEQCNMLLLLMLARLEYSIPLEVLQATLETAKLATIGDIHCIDLFMLPRNMVLDIASLLLSAATVDRLDRKEGGLYSQLYKSLCFTMDSVQNKVKCNARKSEIPLKRPRGNHTAWHCLLASEVVHLMCLVPQFFDLLQANEGLTRMTAIATRTPDVSRVIANVVWKVQSKGGDVWEVYQDIASYLLKATSSNVSARRKRHPAVRPTVHKTTSQLFHPTQPRVSPRLLRAMSAGVAARSASRRSKSGRNVKEPELGDMVVINTEQVARIVALPDSRTAVLQMNATSSTSIMSSEYPDAYVYTDTNGLVWDHQLKYWTKDSLAADFSSSQLSDTLSCATLPTIASITSLNDSAVVSRAATPEHTVHRVTRPMSRPLSGVSFRSDDLQTIPSEEELIKESQGDKSSSNGSSPRGVQSSPIRVDFGLAVPSTTSVTSESDHQNHVLQQYSLNQLRTGEHKTSMDVQLSPRSQALRHLQKSTKEAKELEMKNVTENDGFTVPSPQLQLAEMWESDKSVPTVSSHNFRPHSCKVIELERQNLRVEPHMTPTPVISLSPSQTMSPVHMIINENLDSSHLPSHDKAVMYDAWTVAKPNSPTKHSMLTSTRLMQKCQPKTHPVARQANQLYSTAGHVGCTILRSKPQEAHMLQQRQTSGKVVGKYHYHHPKAARMYGGTTVRKLGKTTPNFFVGNVSTRT